MSVFKFGRSFSAQEVHGGLTRGLHRNTALGSLGVKSSRHMSTADFAQTCDMGGLDSSNGYQSSYFNPVRDRLDRGSVVEEWVPHSLPALNRMYRNIYARDNVAGLAVDIWSTMPWSKYDIVGIEDPAILQFYRDAILPLFTPKLLEDITREILIHGRFCANLIYDSTKGYWTQMLPNDPNFIDIMPVPVAGIDPLINLRMSPGDIEFLLSPDPRLARIRKNIPQHFLNNLRTSGQIPLEPYNTLWVARQISPYDYVGTSMLTRVIPYWAIEKPLLNATVIAARRRAGPILHVTIDSTAESGGLPTTEELTEIAGMFIQADMDPVGAVVATRAGIEANEITGGGQGLWKLSDDSQFLVENKMRACGMNEEWLTGQASYNNYDDSRSVFMDQVRSLRDTVVTKTILKYAEILARAHGFVKTSKARIDHKVKVKHLDKTSYDMPNGMYPYRSLTIEEAMAIPKEDLILPVIQFEKSLKAEGDMHLLELVEKIEDKGVTIPIRTWTQLAGISLDDIMDELPQDAKIRKKFAKYKADIGEGEGGEDEGGGDEDFSLGSVNAKNAQKLSKLETLKKFKSIVRREYTNLPNNSKHLIGGV